MSKTSNMRVEIRDACKVLKDFGVKITNEDKEEWKTWTPIKLENYVLMKIKEKLGDNQ